MARKKSTQSAHHLPYIAIVSVVAVIAIVILILSFTRQAPLSEDEALAGAARFQIARGRVAAVPTAVDAQKVTPDFDTFVQQATQQKSKVVGGQPVTIECPEFLYPSKQDWENIPENLHILQDGSGSGKRKIGLFFIKRTCSNTGAHCGYAETINDPTTVWIGVLATECTPAGDRGCTCSGIK